MARIKVLAALMALMGLALAACGPPRGGRGGGSSGDDDDATDDDDAADDDDASDDDDDASNDDDAADDDDATSSADVDVSGFFPFLEMVEGIGGDLVFPTYVAHLLGSDVDEPWWGGDFACGLVENTGSASLSIEVSAELVGYSSATSELLEVAPGESEGVCLNPVPDLEALYALSSQANAQARLRFEDATNGGLVGQVSDPVEISTQETIFFALNNAPARSSAATLVRPDAPAVIDVLDDMVELSWFGGSIGVGGYRAHQPNLPYWPQQSVSIGAGGYYWRPAYLEVGETIYFQGDSNGADSWLYLMDSAAFQDLQNGDPFLVWWQEEIDTLASGSFTASTAGWYYLVAYNYSSLLSETVTWSSTMTRADNVLDYLYIAYTYLQNLGVNYLNVANSFFDGAQECVLPDDVIANGGGNCIDGTMLFASLLEQMGARPIITFVPGHAFISVDSGPFGANTVWSLETTMLGSGQDFWTALDSGIQQHAAAPFDGYWSLDMYIDDARAAGVLPMP